MMCMHIACWIPKATHTPNMVYLLLFHCNRCCTNTSQCYVTRTLSVLFIIVLVSFALCFSLIPTSYLRLYRVLNYQYF